MTGHPAPASALALRLASAALPRLSHDAPTLLGAPASLPDPGAVAPSAQAAPVASSEGGRPRRGISFTRYPETPPPWWPEQSERGMRFDRIWIDPTTPLGG